MNLLAWNLDDMAIQNNRHLQGQGSTLPIESRQGGLYFHWAE